MIIHIYLLLCLQLKELAEFEESNNYSKSLFHTREGHCGLDYGKNLSHKDTEQSRECVNDN